MFSSQDDVCREQVWPLKRMGAFNIQQNVLREVRSGGYDAAVLMFDLHWVNSILAACQKQTTRVCLWGNRYGGRPLANRVRDFAMRRADALIQYSDCEISRMVSSGIDRDKIFVAPNTLQVANQQDCSDCQKDSLLFVGRAQPRKRVDVLLKAFAASLPSLPEHIMLRIVGGGELNNTLQALSKELQISDRVEFTGEIIDSEILKQSFQRALAYVSPGPVGLGVLHSFAYGVPVVTCQTGYHGPEFSNLIHDENSIVYQQQCELAGVLSLICQNRSFAKTLGGNAYKHYSQHRTLDAMVAGFSDAIENRHRQPSQRQVA